ncbi:MAG: hypothetical protein M3R06_08040 [Chloroflexota bacterium]|nr:hypothetical protein [Chloroflexota bacterium]
MFSRIHSATIAVADQDAARDFYVNTLGWEIGMDTSLSDTMRWLTVVPPGATTPLALGHVSWFSNGDTPRKETGISLVTSDIDTT